MLHFSRIHHIFFQQWSLASEKTGHGIILTNNVYIGILMRFCQA